ncbi:MAG: Unknown protein [uncultured Sulfurovum sp.]|uniref:Uncharacterized protein n=1 Tax=uncultured Sulfurovum sp. TaxID=269237 RepID=A0A6S6TD42_9BACT|nr:MAG: Unknown protein [uncultured Sulfurovum sp.]
MRNLEKFIRNLYFKDRRESLKNKNTKRDWVDFTAKIIYLYEKLFNSDKELLIKYFSDKNSNQKLSSRKKTIENWLKGETKKPNSFHPSRFRINEYKLNGEALLSTIAFQKWSLETFKKRVNLYLIEKQNFNIPNKMKYIYFFSTTEKKLSYFKINYLNKENDTIISLNSPTYTSNTTYHGTISTHSSMCYINVSNDFDHMNYIFKNNVDFYQNDIKVFGVAQSVDALTREPKAFLSLLSSSQLTQEEEYRFAHKLNYSNLMIADDFSHGCTLERDYFLENFSQKIHDLNRDTQHYAIHEHFKDDMYFDIVLQEYQSYIKLLEQSLYHNDYPINHKRQSILFALKHMCKNKKEKATILYLLNTDTLSILDAQNSIMNMQLSLVKEKKLTLSYLFIIEDISLLNERIIEKLHYLEENNISIKLTTNSRSIYSKILIIENKNFAIYKRKNEQNDNHVTKSANSIELLGYEVEALEKEAIPIQAFLDKNYPLNGCWYHYAFSSKKDTSSFHETIFNINNYSFTASYPKGQRTGSILQTEEYTLILLEHSVIRLHNIFLKENRFYVSIIGKEIGIHHKDVLLFGLFSRTKLSKEQTSLLLKSIHQKDDEAFRVKICNNFDSTLAYFDMDNDTLT